MKLVAEVKIEPEQLKELIKKYLMDEGYDVTKIEFEAGTAYSSAPGSMSSWPVFKCVKAIVTRSDPIHNGVPVKLGWK